MASSTSNFEETKADRRVAYGKALARVREAHREEFNGYMTDEMAKMGIEWVPRLSDEEKAEAQVRELLEKYPNLRTQLTGV